ncbi:MAG TPA: MFS transporter [Polyangiaceae bacterium]|nr:MFS transporter [Polyangiaceae bacterium]
MKKATLGTLFLTVFLDLLGFGLVVPFLPRMARELGAGDFTATLIGSAYSLMQLVFVPLWGRLSDRVGRRPVLLWSIAATALSMGTLSVSTSLVTLFAARVFSGVATANIAVTQAYIADVTAPEERSRGMGMLGIAFSLGFILGPFFGGQLAGLRLWGRQSSGPALAAAALAAVNLAIALKSLPESLPPERRAAPGSPELPRAPSAPPPSAPAAPRGSLALPLALPLALNLLIVTSFAGLEQTFALFTHDAFKFDARATGNVFGLMGFVAALVQGGLIRRLTRRVGEVALIRVGLTFQIAAFTLLALAPGLGPGALYAAVVVIGCGSGILSPSVSSYVSQKAAATTQGATLGVLQSTGALGRTLGPGTGGALYQGAGLVAPYVASAVGMTVAWLLSWRLEGLARRPAGASEAPPALAAAGEPKAAAALGGGEGPGSG